MGQALIVNPYDVEQVAYALQMAIHMPLNERRARHRALLATIKKEDVHAWSRSFLSRLQSAQPGSGSVLPLDRKNESSQPAN
jgi:trehalose 6-phosphate synthase